MTGQTVAVALFAGALFALGLFCNPPRRGRHHVHAWLLARPFERERPTVEQIAGRLRAEARAAAADARYLTIEPSFEALRSSIRDRLNQVGQYQQWERFA